MRRIISITTAVVLFGTGSIVAQEQDDDLGVNIGGLSVKNEGNINMKKPYFWYDIQDE